MKYWEADIKGAIYKAPTLKALANLLKIKPTLVEGAYYRKRLEDEIKIRKVVVEDPKPFFSVKEFSGEVRFD